MGLKQENPESPVSLTHIERPCLKVQMTPKLSPEYLLWASLTASHPTTQGHFGVSQQSVTTERPTYFPRNQMAKSVEIWEVIEKREPRLLTSQQSLAGLTLYQVQGQAQEFPGDTALTNAAGLRLLSVPW